MLSIRIGPSSVSRDEFVIIRLSLSWILQRNTLDWYKKQVYNELTKLHPGVFPVYDTPVWNDNDNRSRCPKGMDQEILIRGEKNMDITLVKVRMSHYFYDTLLEWSKQEIETFTRQNLPDFKWVREIHLVGIRICLSWMMNRDCLHWKKEDVFETLRDLHPTLTNRFTKKS